LLRYPSELARLLYAVAVGNIGRSIERPSALADNDMMASWSLWATSKRMLVRFAKESAVQSLPIRRLEG
jgi:hypothetical protein